MTHITPKDEAIAPSAVSRLRRLVVLRLLALSCAVVLIVVAAWRIPGLSVWPLILIVGLLAALDLALIWYLRGPNAARLSERAAELAESQRGAEAQTAEMRLLNQQLLTANEEWRHQRDHLDAAYLELEQAHVRLEVRSSQLSELNEKLRSSISGRSMSHFGQV